MNARLMLGVGLCVLGAGCAAPGARQGTAETQVAIEPVVEAVADLDTTIKAKLETVIAATADQSDRIVREVKAGQDLTIDQSTADKWLARLLAGGLVLVLLSYPVGKLIWLTGGRIRGRGASREGAGLVESGPDGTSTPA